LYEFKIKAVHIPGIDNRLADYLSRWHLNEEHANLFKDCTKYIALNEHFVRKEDFEFVNNW